MQMLVFFFLLTCEVCLSGFDFEQGNIYFRVKSNL